MLRGRSGLSPVMIGRAGPLGTLLQLVDAARRRTTNEPTIALVSGDAGIGKTRLLTELGRRLDDDIAVLAGQAEPTSLGSPYGIVASMLPVGEDITVEGTTAADVTDRVLARLGDRTAVVIFEDLHWADAGSVAVLSRLALTERAGLVLIASYRPDDITQRLPGGELLVRLERSRQVTRLHLDPLRRVEVGAFLAEAYGRPMPSAVIDAMLVRTGGNPFFLEEIVHAAGSIEPEQLASAPLPWSLTDLVSEQLDGLSAEERRVVDAAAVLGNRGSFDVLMTMTGCDEDELIERLRSLVRQGLLVEDGDDDFSFRHALVRDAIARQLLSRERRRLHGAALAALRDACCADLADLARHAAGAQLWDEMVEVAREGVPYYLAHGASHQALRLAADALGERPDDCELLAGAASAAWRLGLTGESLGHAERWLEQARQRGLLEQEAAASRIIARLYYETWDERLWPHVATLEQLAERLDAGVERASVLGAIAQINMLADRTDAAIAFGEQAVEAAELVGAKEVRTQAKIELGSALAVVVERMAEGERILREAIDEAELLGDWVLVARGLHNLQSYVRGDDFEAIEQLIARHHIAAPKAGFDLMKMHDCSGPFELAAARGDMDAARDSVAHLVPLAEMLGSARHGDLSPEPRLAMLDAEAGNPQRAIELMRTAPAPSGRADEWSNWYIGEIAAHAGDPGPALAIVARVATDMPLTRFRRLPDELHLYAEHAMRAGASSRQVDDAIAPLRTNDHPWTVRAVTPVDAEIAMANGEHARVIELLAPLVGTGTVPGGEARSRSRMRFLLATSLAATGQRVDALAVASAAAVDLARWPGYRSDEIARLVARLSTTVAGAGSLTARELEVAAEVAKGRSNAELARELFISPKTAAVHVSNILAKLGLANRAEIAAWYVRNADEPRSVE